MNRFKLQTKKTTHKPCKSNADFEVFKGAREESQSALESPLFGKHLKNDRCLKTFDNRELMTTEPSEDLEHIKTKFRVGLEDEKVNPKERPKKVNKRGPSLDLLKDQDKIIKLQSNLIDNLRNEISLLENGKKIEIEASGESSKKVRIKEDEKTEEFEMEIKKINKILKRKDELIKEMKVEMDISIQKKDIKISQLESEIERLRLDNSIDNSEFKNLKDKYEKEINNREKIENELGKSREQNRVITEENKLLIQNYEELRRRFFEYENTLKPIKKTVNRISNSKCDTQNIPYFIESLSMQNKNYSEKVKFLNEKISSNENENEILKNDLSKFQRKINELKFKSELGEENEALIEKLQKKNKKILELKKMLSSFDRKNRNEYSSDSKFCPAIDSQISVIEEELNLLKTENKILSNKDNELNNKLKSSENARYYYQEQTIHLKERVNYLENQLKMIETSIQELKSQNESFPKKVVNVNRY